MKQKLLKCITDPQVEFGICIHHIESGEDTFLNPDTVFPTASIFKVPLMVEVFKQIREGKFSLDERLKLEDKDKTLTSGILMTLQEGLMLTIQDLLVLMTIVSDNVATTMLLRLVGAQNVTTTMHSLGLNSIWVNITVHEMFLHAFGIPERKEITLDELVKVAKTVPMSYDSLTFSRGKDNNVATARDICRLMRIIFKGEVIDREACDKMLVILNLQQHEWRIPRYLPWLATANKTGTMRGLRNDSGIITCNPDSHVAYSIFSFDPTPLSITDPRIEVRRGMLVDNMMAKMGEKIYIHYGGKY